MTVLDNRPGPDARTAFRVAVGSRVRFARSLQGLSQDQLAGRAGVSRTFVSRIERGTHGLDAWQLSLVAQAVDRPLRWLLGDDELPPRPR